ncbi:aminoacylase [Vibrio vulnificus]|uniref:aminoacylase n=1 Tax=Vibrio vulnificus TaxID=672 RepID=UPI0009D5F2DC|nr:aminoacylase [Vibrio vulnificus]ELJ8616144.1 aminoacylase [Vibrio cholerae]ELJ8695223.1 aminoacylase [Vibrio cholerae]OQK36288.1 D-glutamate deacylase [Vibrio vulnificus]OQK50416.1 D-glutamate deacylase [Vibrio vulnificus]OQK60951.1 D-glutamate deacylase [Vibrio vulnificus]
MKTNVQTKLKLTALSLMAVLGTALSFSAVSETYDIVINNGRVMDPETNFDAVRNVGVKDGKIVVITEDALKGKQVIDAKGLVVAPGFIDTHFHFQMPIGYSLGLRDGLTSSMDFEMGCAGSYMEKWYKAREGVTQANYGCAVSHEFARAKVIDGSDGDYLKDGPLAALTTRAKTGWSATRPTLEQGNKILEEIDKGLQAGAPGIGSTVGYMREGVSSREMFEVQKVGARYGRPTGAHTRYTLGTDTTEVNGAQELIANALALDAPAIVLHFNNPGWRVTHEMITGLQAQGHNIWGEVYPYAAGSTTINASFLEPKSWIDYFGNRYEDTMLDPVTGEYYTTETYKDTVASEPTRQIVIFKMPAEDEPKWLTLKGVTMASDGVGATPYDAAWDYPLEKLGGTHPRTAGARGATIRLGREHNIPMMQLMSILSYNAAKHLGDTGLTFMQERGRMQTGKVADIVVFDPELFTDNSTYVNGSIPSTGMKAVIVNGQVTVRDDVLLPVFAGQPIRFEPEAKPRFEPISVEEWNKKFSTGMPDVTEAFPQSTGK